MSEQVELSVLALLANDEAAQPYLDVLSETDFLSGPCADILKAMKTLRAANMPVNVVSINAETNGKYAVELARLGDYLLDGGDIEERIKVLKDVASKRQLQLILQKAVQAITDGGKTAVEIKNDIMQMLDGIKTDYGHNNDEAIDMQSVMLSTLDYIDERYNKRNDQSLYTGFHDLDNATAGLHEEEMTVIAARPGVGKTAFGSQIGLKLAANGKKVLFISREMSKIQLGIRFIAGETAINGNRIRRGNITDQEWQKISAACGKLGDLPVWIDNECRTVADVRTLARQIKNKHGLDVLIVDYLQLLEAVGRHDRREQEVAEVSRTLKLLSLEFKIPVIVLSQFNRDADGKRPTLRDLRESGSIEQDSDNVIALYKPEPKDLNSEFKQYEAQLRQNGNELVEVIILKQRNGPVGTVYLGYIPQQLKFVNLKFREVSR